MSNTIKTQLQIASEFLEDQDFLLDARILHEWDHNLMPIMLSWDEFKRSQPDETVAHEELLSGCPYALMALYLACRK